MIFSSYSWILFQFLSSKVASIDQSFDKTTKSIIHFTDDDGYDSIRPSSTTMSGSTKSQLIPRSTTHNIA